ncbi:MAG: hypothetical protein ACPH5K_08095 [Polaribacter sp.]
MKFPYKKGYQRLNLFLGMLWGIQFIWNLYEDQEFRLSNVMWLLLSVTYLGIFLYNRKEQYLTIENGIIKQNWPFGKQVKIEEIVKVRYFAGDYTLTTKNQELKINTQILNPDYFELLKTEIDKIEAA